MNYYCVQWATFLSRKRVPFLLVDVLVSFPSIQQNAQGSQLAKRKWLITLEFPAHDWLVLLLWAAATASAHND